MKKILFITSRNIMTTCGELRLIKNRAKILQEEYGYTTEFITYRLKKREQNETVGKIIDNYRDPIDRRRLVSETQKLVKSGQYNCIILSGVNVYFLIPIFKAVSENYKIILDIHGTVEELIEFRNSNIKEQVIFGSYYRLIKYYEKKYVPLADGILTVSSSLAEMYQKISRNNNLKCFIAPCATSDNMTYDEYLSYRDKYRKKYLLDETDKVFVYSGGASPWQCVEESVELFRKIRQNIGKPCKLLLFSGNKELVEKYQGEDGIITATLPPDEVIHTLCAGDFGIMLREDRITNNVAFPNKFLEYVESRLRVITTPYVYDIKDYIHEYNIGYIIGLPLIDSDINLLCNSIRDYYDKREHFRRCEELIKKCDFKETLKYFVKYIRGN